MKIVLLLFFLAKIVFSQDFFELKIHNGRYEIELDCKKAKANILLLRDEKFVISHLFSDEKLSKCLLIRKITLKAGISNISLVVDHVVFNDQQSELQFENFQNIIFKNQHLLGHVNLIFHQCLSIVFDESDFQAKSMQLQLFNSRIEASDKTKISAFDRYADYVLIDHSYGHDTKYGWIHRETKQKLVIISGNAKYSTTMSNLHAQLKATNLAIPVSIPVFCILLIFVAILGISLIWTKWILESERRLLRWYVANTVGDEEEFIEEHVLLRNSNVVRNGTLR